jgi:hypothetical protein
MHTHLGKEYSSKKHPLLEYIFRKYNPKNEQLPVIVFYLSDISEAYRACGIPEPVSISNTILDLTRQDRGPASRLPDSLVQLGYDLEKKTGVDTNGKKFAGQFVYVGLGNSLQSWLDFPDTEEDILIVNSKNIPLLVRDLIRPDEAGLFSVLDYTDTLSKVLFDDKIKVFRVQNPMKWQPNEIDGFYASETKDEIHLYPTEAKALTTKDGINLIQLKGGYNTVVEKVKKIDQEVFKNKKVNIQSLALKMIPNGIDCAIFPANEPPITPEKIVRIKFDPPIKNWL